MIDMDGWMDIQIGWMDRYSGLMIDSCDEWSLELDTPQGPTQGPPGP